MKINSIKFKLCVLYVGTLGLLLVGYRAALYYNLYQTLYRDSDTQLIAKATEVRKNLRVFTTPLRESKRAVIFGAKRMLGVDVTYPDKEQLTRIEEIWRKTREDLALNKDYINFLNEEGKTVVSSPNIDRGLSSFLEAYAKTDNAQPAFHNIVYKESLNLRIIVMPVDFADLGKYTLQIGISTDPIIYVLRERINKSAISIPWIMLAAVIFSYLLVWRILRPVKQIAKIANDISHKNLSARVNLKDIDQEIKPLAESFNDMIERLEESFTYVEDFSSYVAHELRTPLTIIKGETEVALQTEHSPAECKSVMQSNLQEVERMLKTIDHLLMLADMNYRKQLINFERVELSEFLKDIYEKSTILAAAKQISVNLEAMKSKIELMANRNELRRLFFNLIDNAIKFTATNGRIDISVKQQKNKVEINIADTGIGIHESDISKIFNKFFRASSDEQHPGSGLGLGIVQSIIRIHQGRILVSSEPNKGSVFTVILPVYQPAKH
ncbi:MAG: HAMP domain-containing protein [Candidatus Omnitrophica bacterium]|nr:HAMP domain-containing protein [Candidatus Omnitrophota bacterium]